MGQVVLLVALHSDFPCSRWRCMLSPLDGCLCSLCPLKQVAAPLKQVMVQVVPLKVCGALSRVEHMALCTSHSRSEPVPVQGKALPRRFKLLLFCPSQPAFCCRWLCLARC